MTFMGKFSLKNGLNALVATVALGAMIAPGVAQAQERRGDNRGQRSERSWDRGNHQRSQQPRVQQPRAQQHREVRPEQRRWNGQNDQRRWNNDRRDNDRRGNDWRNNDRRDNDRRDNDRRWNNNQRWDNGRDHDRRWNNYRRPSNNGWHNGWRNDRRYNWQGYRNQYRDRYRMPTYYSPYRGRGYSRLSIGISLGSGYYGSRYWINDPYQYRLPPAPYGARWVRYYNDVVLVDMRRGRVIDVIHNFFW